MLKNISKLEIEIEGIKGKKSYQFLCDMDCPLNEVKESLFQFIKYVGMVEDNIKAQEAKKAQQDTSIVESISEDAKAE